MISRFSVNPWPASCPDQSHLDFWFWPVCLVELRKSTPGSSEDIEETVNSFARHLSIECIAKATDHITAVSKACFDVDGGAFEHRVKAARRRLFSLESSELSACLYGNVFMLGKM